MEALTLMELRHEEKLFGNKLSIRQVLYLGAGALGMGVCLGTADLLARIPAPRVIHWGIWGVCAGIGLVPAIGAILWAFVPALGLGPIPGPTLPLDDDPASPPIRLDQWWQLQRAHRARPPLLPYRRTRGLAGAGFIYLDRPGASAAPTQED